MIVIVSAIIEHPLIVILVIFNFLLKRNVLSRIYPELLRLGCRFWFLMLHVIDYRLEIG